MTENAEKYILFNFTIFKEDDMDCPVIIYFPLINKDFREFSAPGVPR